MRASQPSHVAWRKARASRTPGAPAAPSIVDCSSSLNQRGAKFRAQFTKQVRRRFPVFRKYDDALGAEFVAQQRPQGGLDLRRRRR
mgnify:CR=1 FL=1